MNGMPIGQGKKFNYRQFFMVCTLLFITTAEILFDYINAGFDPSVFYDPSYWIKLGATCLSIVLVTLTVRDFFREQELNYNPNIKKVQGELDVVHAELSRRNLMTNLEAYIKQINSERKLKAYRSYLQYNLFRAKPKHKDKWTKLIEKAGESINFLPTFGKKIRVGKFKWIKFNRVSTAMIFARSGKTKRDDEDLDSDEMQEIKQMLFRKLMPVVAFSITLSTLFVDSGTFAVAILFNTFVKLFRIAMSIYTGVMSGQDFVKVNLLCKMERRLEFVQKFLEKEKGL